MSSYYCETDPFFSENSKTQNEETKNFTKGIDFDKILESEDEDL